MAPKLGTFKYDHGDRIPVGWVNWLAGLLCVPVALAGFALAPPLGIVAVIATVIFWMVRLPKQQIRLGTRYAIVGNTIVYFRNVRKMELRAGELILHWDKDRRLRIEQSRFPTNARKQDKIAKNKAAKFEKVTGKIIDRVLHASPTVELAGIDRQARFAERAAKVAQAGKAGT
jgi:hypothetical protein